MDPELSAFLRAWEWRPIILIIQILFGATYLKGWFTLRRKKAKIANGWRLASYFSGQFFFTLALMSGIDSYQSLLLFIHMIQHLLLVMIVPALLFLGAPMPIGMWGLPRSVRLDAGKLLGRHSLLRKGLVELSSPGTIWLIFTAILWLWHDPNAYNTAVENQMIHDIEHITFFGSGMLLWWHIVGAAPRIHKHRGYVVRLVLIGLTYFQTVILGMGITMWGKVIYSHYAEVPRMWGIDPKLDQTIAGLIMWLPGGMMYLVAVIVLLGWMIQDSEKKSHRRPSVQSRKAFSSQ